MVPGGALSHDALDSLYARFDLSAPQQAPRLRILNDPDAGVFSVRIDRAAGEKILPVTDWRRATRRTRSC